MEIEKGLLPKGSKPGGTKPSPRGLVRGGHHHPSTPHVTAPIMQSQNTTSSSPSLVPPTGISPREHKGHSTASIMRIVSKKFRDYNNLSHIERNRNKYLFKAYVLHMKPHIHSDSKEKRKEAKTKFKKEAAVSVMQFMDAVGVALGSSTVYPFTFRFSFFPSSLLFFFPTLALSSLISLFSFPPFLFLCYSKIETHTDTNHLHTYRIIVFPILRSSYICCCDNIIPFSICLCHQLQFDDEGEIKKGERLSDDQLSKTWYRCRWPEVMNRLATHMQKTFSVSEIKSIRALCNGYLKSTKKQDRALINSMTEDLLQHFRTHPYDPHNLLVGLHPSESVLEILREMPVAGSAPAPGTQ